MKECEEEVRERYEGLVRRWRESLEEEVGSLGYELLLVQRKLVGGNL